MGKLSFSYARDSDSFALHTAMTKMTVLFDLPPSFGPDTHQLTPKHPHEIRVPQAMIAAASPPITDVVAPFAGVFILIGIVAGLKMVLEQWLVDKRREKRHTYYRVTYLKSDDWKRKRALVLKRDRYRCVCCGRRAHERQHEHK
jgi:hypothetical protein